MKFLIVLALCISVTSAFSWSDLFFWREKDPFERDPTKPLTKLEKEERKLAREWGDIASLDGLKWKDQMNILHPDVRFDTYNNGTALHIFASDGYHRCTKFLLSCGYDRTIKDNSGKTALDLAKDNGHRKVVKLLRTFSPLPVKYVFDRAEAKDDNDGDMILKHNRVPSKSDDKKKTEDKKEDVQMEIHETHETKDISSFDDIFQEKLGVDNIYGDTRDDEQVGMRAQMADFDTSSEEEYNDYE